MYILDVQARHLSKRIDRRSATQRGQLWLAWRTAGLVWRDYTLKSARRRPSPLHHARFNCTIAKIGRARRAEWRERHARA